MSAATSVREIVPCVYWVGTRDIAGGLDCNPYLLIDGGEGVLIDPGSRLDFEAVYANVNRLLPLANIKYVVLHHQDPDFCSSMPLFEQKGLQAQIVTHWRTSVLLKYYGIQSPYYIVNQKDFRLTLASGRALLFFPTPYLHFPGAIATYDTQTKTLFSSDLFGAFAAGGSDLFAGPSYLEPMKAFHEHYMPGNEILRPVMEKFLTVDIACIAPQHGCVIRQDIPAYIKALRDLECGTFLNPVKKDLAKSGGYLGIVNLILKRLYAIFDAQEIRQALAPEAIVFDSETGLIEDFNCTGHELWNKVFSLLFSSKGLEILTILEPLAQKIAKEYDIPLPEILQSKIVQGAQEVIALSEKNRELLAYNQQLQENMAVIQERLTKCPITGLYNEAFFWDYLSLTFSKNEISALLLVSIDDLAGVNVRHGIDIGYETLKNLAYLLNNIKTETQQIFKLNDPLFACCLAGVTKAEAVNIAETIRKTVADAELFIEKITVSSGVLHFDEISERVQVDTNYVREIHALAFSRLLQARRAGGNAVCSQSTVTDENADAPTALLADSDAMNLEILSNALKNEGFRILTAHDGMEALSVATKESIQLIIAALMLPKLDGLLVKDQLSRYSDKARIPFILTSHQKDAATVDRALSLDVDYYLKKPYMLTEIIGLSKNLIKRGRNDGS